MCIPAAPFLYASPSSSGESLTVPVSTMNALLKSVRQRHWKQTLSRIAEINSGTTTLSPEWRYRLTFLKAYALEQLDSFSKARELYSQLVETDYLLAERALFKRAYLCEKLSKPQEAFSSYLLFLKRYKTSQLRFLALKKAAEAAHTEDEENALLATIEDWKEDTPSVLLVKAKLHYSLKQYTKAFTSLQRLLVYFPATREAKLAKKLHHSIMQRTKSREFQLSLTDKERRLRGLMDAHFYITAFNEARELSSRVKDPQLKGKLNLIRGKAALQRGHYLTAERIFRSLLTHKEPRLRIQALSNLTLTLIKRHRFREAVQTVKKLQKKEQNPELSFAAYSLLIQELIEEAEYKRAGSLLELIPHSKVPLEELSTYYFSKGMVRLLLQEHQAAIHFLKKARDNAAVPAERRRYLFWLGKANWLAGNRQAAGEIWDSALPQAEPDYYYLRSLLIRGSNIRRAPWAVKKKPSASLEEVRATVFRLEGSPLLSVDNWPAIQEMKLLGFTTMYSKALDNFIQSHPDFCLPRLDAILQNIGEGDYHTAIVNARAVRDVWGTQYLSLNTESFYRIMYPLDHTKNILHEARRRKLDPALIAAVILQESSFDSHAHSHAGARGLMQIMPSVGKWMARRIRLHGYRHSLLKVPRYNIKLGVAHLSWLHRLFGEELVPTLAGYNAGRSKVLRWQKKIKQADEDLFLFLIPYDETDTFVKRVLRNYLVYAKLYPMLSP